MTNLNLIVLSYHQFNEKYNTYRFSRMYSEFREDLENKTFDLVTVDDAHYSALKAFEMMTEKNIRGILFVPSSLVGKEGYLTWAQVNHISKYHEVGNHSHRHVDLRELPPEKINEEILTCNMLIEKHIGRRPRFLVPPYNKYNKHVENVAEKLNLQIVRNRKDIINDTP